MAQDLFAAGMIGVFWGWTSRGKGPIKPPIWGRHAGPRRPRKRFKLTIVRLFMGLKYHNPFQGRPHEAYRRPTTRYDGDTPNHPAFTINETWGALKRCWRGYRIAKKYGDGERMKLYAKRIRKLQFELGISIADFPDIGLFGTDPEDVRLSCD